MAAILELAKLMWHFTEKADTARIKQLTLPVGVAEVRDLGYLDDGDAMHRLDVYYPMDATEPLPVIIDVHGGGWIAGDKAGNRPYMITLAREGFAVVSFNYRLAPESRFPASLEDTNAAFSWLLAHADEYGFDTGHIFGVGDSAGAHLLAMYACVLTNPAYAAQFGLSVPEGLRLSALALNCGQYELSPSIRTEDPQTFEIMGYYLSGPSTDEALDQISPAHYVTADFPPCFLMSCAGDFLLPQVPVMQQALEKARVPFEYHYYTDGRKPLGHVFHINVAKEVSRRCNHEECGYFRRFL